MWLRHLRESKRRRTRKRKKPICSWMKSLDVEKVDELGVCVCCFHVGIVSNDIDRDED